MRVFESPVLTVQSSARQQVFAALVAAPHRDWTVAQMAELVPDISIQGVRTTLHLLLGDHLVEIEPLARRSSLTLRLTSDGEQILTAILRRWANGDNDGEKVLFPAAPGGQGWPLTQDPAAAQAVVSAEMSRTPAQSLQFDAPGNPDAEVEAVRQ